MKYFIIIFFILSSCSQTHKHGHNKANTHMHQKDSHQLILSFDDPARDKWQKPKKVLELLGNLGGVHIIDIGSGSGYFTKYFLNAKANVVAADVDEKFLKHIQESFPNKKFPNLKISHIPFDDPRMSEAEFDIAFNSNTYHHIDNRVEYLKKVYKGLKNGGKLVTLDFKLNVKGKLEFGPPMSMRVPASLVVEELLLAGFDYIEVNDKDFEYQFYITAYKNN